VQGVFYRDTAKRQADLFGVAGWVRNLADGRVEIVAEGDVAAVEQLARWAWEGSPRARVTDVTSTTEAPEGLEGFRSI